MFLLKTSQIHRVINPCFILNSIRTYSKKIQLFNNSYDTDEWTNITENIQDKLSRNLLHTPYHPLKHLKNKIKHYFYHTYQSRLSTPLFSIFDNFNPVVSIDQNFDRFAFNLICNVYIWHIYFSIYL